MKTAPSVEDLIQLFGDPNFQIPALKHGGSYQAKGKIVGMFRTVAGLPRVVFEFDEPKGMLHIFAPNQLTVAPEYYK